ncbi:MAG: hypothetical protein ACI3T9_07995 [Romboutsia timonensis]
MMIDINELKVYKGLIKVESIEELQDLVNFYIKEINPEDRELTEDEINAILKRIDEWGFAFIEFNENVYMLEDRDIIYELYYENAIAYISYNDIIWETDVYNFADFIQKAPSGLYEANIGYVTLIVDKGNGGLIKCKDKEYMEEMSQFLSDIFCIQEMFEMSFELIGKDEHFED